MTPQLAASRKDLVQTVERLMDRVDDLESTVADQQETVDDLESTVADQQETIDDLETELEEEKAKNRALANKAESTKQGLSELQARELEKGAHLQEETVDEYEVDVDGGRLERIQKEDGRSYFRLPQSEDPIGRGGATTLAYSDLLPIQQLAQLDDDMLKRSTSTKPDYLAAKLWQAREDGHPWKKGCKGVREYISASDMKHWIRTELGRTETSEANAKKLVDRTIDSLQDLSQDRLRIGKTKTGRSGATCKERRIMIMADAEIPGETSEARGQTSSTAEPVHGD